MNAAFVWARFIVFGVFFFLFFFAFLLFFFLSALDGIELLMLAKILGPK